ncbi:MAG TPA: exodeoxyribonuclease VII large subunit [Candidatus Copromorpha excrementigallinarum]|uniref:Exodeoxyribonuclease 7 large subunit n=1 Tax=Candidatus Allocopromorpha excrementigallinarum TaxID=2840742 RepID=A0A9D1I216_9FIRM|nr:exodeoxyribonuclease VII large subunit [Candidatus Copromorpha excrementigallinarum]
MGLKPVTVSQLNNYIKRILQTDPLLGSVSVRGEVSNLKFHSSGHVYFSLKDEASRVSCFLPAGSGKEAYEALGEGLEVIVSGYIYLYHRGGSYSVNVKDIERAGEGDLAEAFRRLKEKLEAEGLFNKENKKALPFFPRRVAVVTSETGAAVRDILKIIKKKNDCVDILIYPVLVQGPRAAGEIALAIDDINENYRDVDVIIAGRGGGSMEELWAFNEEEVARSIYRSKIPVISAVGHETDFTIADFAADVRAETPTAAAEMAVPDTGALREELKKLAQGLKRDVMRILERQESRLKLMDPQRAALDIKGKAAMEQLKADRTMEAMTEEMKRKTAVLEGRLRAYKEALEASNPRTILSRGYSVVTDEEGRVIKSVSALNKGDRVRIQTGDGSAEGNITKVLRG